MNYVTKNEHASLTFNNNKTLSFKLDTGAETNILTKADFDKIVPKRQRTSKLRPSTAKLTAYGGHAIPILGKCYLQCQYQSSKQVIEFHVVEKGKSLLGCTSCQSLKLVTFHNVDQLHSTETNDTERRPTRSLSELDSPQIFDKYSQCFEGIGCISKPYDIKLKPDANPVVHPPRKFPAALRVFAELNDMESNGIIKPVNEPTAWVNSMVVNEKRNGKLRICIDPRDFTKPYYANIISYQRNRK